MPGQAREHVEQIGDAAGGQVRVHRDLTAHRQRFACSCVGFGRVHVSGWRSQPVEPHGCHPTGPTPRQPQSLRSVCNFGENRRQMFRTSACPTTDTAVEGGDFNPRIPA